MSRSVLNDHDRERAMRGGRAGPVTAFTAVAAVRTNAAAGPLREGAYQVQCLTNAFYVNGPTDRTTALAATTGQRVSAGQAVVLYADGDNSATGHAYIAVIRVAADSTGEIVGISDGSAVAAPPAIA